MKIMMILIKYLKKKWREKSFKFISTLGCKLFLKSIFLRRSDRRLVINYFMKHIWWKWPRLKVYTVLFHCRLSFLVGLLILIYFISFRLFAESCVPEGKIKRRDERVIGIIGICLLAKILKKCAGLMVVYIGRCSIKSYCVLEISKRIKRQKIRFWGFDRF